MGGGECALLTVRPYRREELPWIVKCAVQTSADQVVAREAPGGSPEVVAAQACRMYESVLMTPQATLLVADWPPGVRGEGPAGYALLLPQPNAFTGEREVVIMDIYTNPVLRGRHVGRLLVEKAAEYARSIGCRSLVAQIALHNGPSRRLFERAGFAQERVVVGRRL